MDLKDVSAQSAEIRSRYHKLEKQIHGSIWSVEEDALAFLSRLFLTRTQLLFALAEYLVGNEVHREFLPLTLFFRFMTSSPVHLKYSGNHAFSSSHGIS